MRGYSKVYPQFWIGKTAKQIKLLGTEGWTVAIYLISCPHANMIGIYYLPLTFITHETGIPLRVVNKTLHSLCQVGFCTYDEQMEYVWVHEMAFYQIGGQLKQHDNRVKGINDLLRNLPKLAFLPIFFAKYHAIFWLENPSENVRVLADPPKLLLSQEQEQEQEQKEKRKTLSGKPDVVSLLNDEIGVGQSLVASSGMSLGISPQPTSLKSQAVEILEFLNQKAKRAYRPVDTNLKLIMARLKSGATVTDCRQVIAKKTREWKSDPKMAEYLRPATLFNATKFEQYVGELILSEEEEIHANQ